MLRLLIENPAILDAVLVVLLAGTSWLGARLAGMAKLAWADRYLRLVGGHAMRAVDSARVALRKSLEKANTDGVVTDQELDSALDDALKAFWAAISPKELARALSATSAKKWTPEDAKAWGDGVISNLLGSDRPLPTQGRSRT